MNFAYCKLINIFSQYLLTEITRFRAFGPLRYARITIDHETGRSRGTAFACFWKREDADKVIQLSETLSKETGFAARPLSLAMSKNAAANLPSLLTPDPSSSLARGLVIHGRTLDVTRAVTRDEAAKLKDEGIKKREKEDKRNVYLMREGGVSSDDAPL
jgi:nucleolar protein 4